MTNEGAEHIDFILWESEFEVRARIPSKYEMTRTDEEID